MLFGIKRIGEQLSLSKISASTLMEMGLNEKDLETLLFENIHDVIRSSDLLAIAHSRNWQEEPDILALDSEGKLYIFELKAWESHQENLLQVMRYTQKFSSFEYESFNRLWKKFGKGELLQAHQDYFGLENCIEVEKINARQVLIVMTNGIDTNTRVAVKYWHSQGLDIRPWIYRVYSIDDENFISFDAFSSSDDPYEDAISSYHIVNTSIRHGQYLHDNMIQNKRASAYNNPWKFSIMNISKSDFVFLYQNAVGILAFGKAQDSYRVSDWDGEEDEEYYVNLDNFKMVDPPITASELRDIADYHVPLLRTYTSLRKSAGDNLLNVIKSR